MVSVFCRHNLCYFQLIFPILCLRKENISSNEGVRYIYAFKSAYVLISKKLQYMPIEIIVMFLHNFENFNHLADFADFMPKMLTSAKMCNFSKCFLYLIESHTAY